MVNLDEVRTGDTLVVEVPVMVYPSGIIEFKYHTVRTGHDRPSDKIKVLGHKTAPIDEPKGIGAVVKLRSKTLSNSYQYFIVNSGNSNSSWSMNGYSNLNSTWDEWMKEYYVVEILSPGVEVDTD